MINGVGVTRILDSIDAPCDIKGLNDAQLARLAAEIREELVCTVSQTGGHLAPNLGVVELTLGIHRALDCPTDKIVFDVGHQSYVHKLITGRRDRFGTLRQYGGLSGFPKRSESEYDSFDTGHASDSLSVALGLALARDARGGKETVLAVIGDGSMTGGMSFEALDQIGHLGARLVVVLNDNEMSISPNVGALSGYLARVRLDRRYQKLRDGVESRLAATGAIGRVMVEAGEAVKDSFKQLVVPGMLFEELGLKYVGPIDGHDVRQVQAAVERAKRAEGPVLIHAITRKGRGYDPAETSPDTFHGIGPFSVETGEPDHGSGPVTYTAAFSAALVAEAEKDPAIVAITAAMPFGTGLDRFAARFPRRFFDVGIAEGHAVGMAAGMAAGGLKPVVAIYSTFLQRAYDQLVTDVALQGLHVVFCLDRAGLVGEDGPTHHGVFDLTYLRSIPGMMVLAPADEAELADALHTALAAKGPVAIRYPRGAGKGILPREPLLLEAGVAEVRRTGDDVALLAVGRMTGVCEKAAELLGREGVSASVINMRWVKPLDRDTIAWAAERHGLVVTAEENTLMGGFGAGVCEILADLELEVPVLRLGIPDSFVPHGGMKRLLADVGLTPEGIAASVLDRLSSTISGAFVASPEPAERKRRVLFSRRRSSR
ncbi:MAG: 1-deoxy-D-xylulose-5-phosphate synthase [Coriobacteriia bacterium]